MNTTAERVSRPLAVNLGLAALLAVAARHIIPTVIYGHWPSPLSDPLLYVKFGFEFALMLVPLWLIFRGKNWARWFLAACACFGFCLSLGQLTRHIEAHASIWIANYCWINGLVVGAFRCSVPTGIESLV